MMASDALEKAPAVAWGKAKPIVVVDWHNTLEKDDEVPQHNFEALVDLLGKAEVHLLSYVKNEVRKKAVLLDMKKVRQSLEKDKPQGLDVVWHMTGKGGKCDVAYMHLMQLPSLMTTMQSAGNAQCGASSPTASGHYMRSTMA